LSRSLGGLATLSEAMGNPLYDKVPAVDLKEAEFLRLCNPSLATDSDRDFEAFWARARAAIASS